MAVLLRVRLADWLAGLLQLSVGVSIFCRRHNFFCVCLKALGVCNECWCTEMARRIVVSILENRKKTFYCAMGDQLKPKRNDAAQQNFRLALGTGLSVRQLLVALVASCAKCNAK